MELNTLLAHIDDVKVETGKDLTHLSTMRLKATGDLITVSSVDSLKKVVKKLQKAQIEYTVLGLGANHLLSETSSIPYIKLSLDYDKHYLDNVRDQYCLPASVSLNLLTAHAIKFGLKGWEVFTGIPATIGGAAVMNAGTNLGEIGDLISSVEVMTKDGEIKKIKMSADSFGYRTNNFLKKGDIIIKVHMLHHGLSQSVSKTIKEYLEIRNKSQPLDKPTCGCIFQNVDRGVGKDTCLAGKIIDIIGLKGFSNGKIRVSNIHANFMENVGGATYSDVIAMIELVQHEVKLQTGLSLTTEVKYAQNT
ncbi:MAG: UDP-N-acetylmuramate dehydrogenase [Bacteriovoracaceae bacterium]|nr:UDP-N-acetylmuramate dehydrogenase [Bacteriovoracaceae bacterium]